ncbi:sugar ABC transporter ATP-binding protein [Brevibacillus choshinensis]|uniref:Sugar ABC transporter ATP-binding protein n=1 Tax=Brevibacillus choshinensis TaxID=54911 RepID=A0ABX7FHS5_BRECH|nr:sugar ABC transporter ATP-binding protein [Brevibacillus choshinensis]QRG65333.1 sugar ABC transporter ATP-binding protein [Brevibacillus choshinensis]
MAENVLHMRGIEKAFNGVPVLKGVDFSLRKGEIHALLGENGAGKSTLMNILGGILQPDAGEISIENKRITMSEPRISQQAGIRFIHQELNVVADLTVYENIFLGAEWTDRFGFLRVEDMCKRTEELLGKMGASLHPKSLVRDLEPSFKQMVEIARALLTDAKIIIMDEPTTALTNYEIEHLMVTMRTLREGGVSIIYISHKLKEVLSVCDRYTVLRDGQLAGSGEVKDTNEEELTRLMVGKSVGHEAYHSSPTSSERLLEVRNLSSGKWFRDIQFSLAKGEILGFTGLAGDGRTELFETIFGCRPYTGEILVKGQPHKLRHPRQALQAGIGLVPKNRKENAIIKDMSIKENLSLASLKHFQSRGLIDGSREVEAFERYRELLSIKVSDPNLPIISLSGGNQQKVVLAKWLEADPDILIFDNPTQGIDVGAKSEIYQIIAGLAQQGKAIIVLSSELPEIMKLCDRVMVMYQGEITGTLKREQVNEELIMLFATGVKKEEQAG